MVPVAASPLAMPSTLQVTAVFVELETVAVKERKASVARVADAGARVTWAEAPGPFGFERITPSGQAVKEQSDAMANSSRRRDEIPRMAPPTPGAYFIRI